jgi:hypothetical protein
MSDTLHGLMYVFHVVARQAIYLTIKGLRAFDDKRLYTAAATRKADTSHRADLDTIHNHSYISGVGAKSKSESISYARPGRGGSTIPLACSDSRLAFFLSYGFYPGTTSSAPN